jgi:hypothetical protein
MRSVLPVLLMLVSVPASADESAPKRVALARAELGTEVRMGVETAGLKYPPLDLFIRVFKFENTLEAWARDAKDTPFKLVLQLPLTDVRARGPKRKEGDYRTPEGCYRITYLNPHSAGYLSLMLNYPNPADRVHADKMAPGRSHRDSRRRIQHRLHHPGESGHFPAFPPRAGYPAEADSRASLSASSGSTRGRRRQQTVDQRGSDTGTVLGRITSNL